MAIVLRGIRFVFCFHQSRKGALAQQSKMHQGRSSRTPSILNQGTWVGSSCLPTPSSLRTSCMEVDSTAWGRWRTSLCNYRTGLPGHHHSDPCCRIRNTCRCPLLDRERHTSRCFCSHVSVLIYRRGRQATNPFGPWTFSSGNEAKIVALLGYTFPRQSLGYSEI